MGQVVGAVAIVVWTAIVVGVCGEEQTMFDPTMHGTLVDAVQRGQHMYLYFGIWVAGLLAMSAIKHLLTPERM